MNKTTIVAVIALVIAIIGLFTPTGKSVLGAITGVTNYNYLGVSQLKIGTTCNDGFSYSGCNGTAISGLNTGKCYIQAYATTITASTTATVDCQATAAVGGITTANDVALTGITSGDSIVTMFATSTPSAFGGIVIIGATASSTAGYITLSIENLTGTTYTWPLTGTATGTVSYFASR